MKQNGIVAALSKVGGARIAALAVSLACTVLSVRLLTNTLGSDVFGAVSLISTLTALVPFADLGLGIVITNLTVDEIHGRQVGALRPGYSTALWTLCAIALVLFAASGIVSAVNGWVHLLGRTTLLLGDPNQYMPIFVGLFGLWLLTGPLYRVLLGLGEAAFAAALQGITPILSIGLTVVFLFGHAPIYLLSFCPLIASLLVSAFALWRVRTRLGMTISYVLAPWRIRAHTYSSILTTGISGLIFTVGTVVILQSDRLVLSLRGTPGELALYSAVVPMFFAVQSVAGAMGGFLWPHYRKLLIGGSLSHRTMRRHILVAAGAGVLVGIATLLLSPLYLELVGYRSPDAAPVVVAVAILVAVQVSTLPATSALTSPRWLKIQGRVALAAAAVKVVLALLLVPVLGASGGLVASILVIGLIQLPSVVFLVLRAAKAGTLDTGLTSSAEQDAGRDEIPEY